MNDYEKYCRPGIVKLLAGFGLDLVYERAKDDSLWQRKGDHLVEILDLVGGYGANLFGHSHPDLITEAKRLLDENVPIHAQGSCRSGAARLAKALCDRVGDYIVILTNTGTEAVEAAIKHAYLEKGKPCFWGLKNAFHGKTLGSIQLTWSYREPFLSLGPQVRFIDPFDPSDWKEAESQINEISAAIIEPILGEGGIKPLPEPFIEWLKGICHKADIPIIVDEIQTGMGRTGTFLASQQFGIEPDYICLSKALGGGLAKIGALMIKRNRFIEEFSVIHTSTFAEDDLSSLIALKALEILDRDDLMSRCEASGKHLMANLELLRTRYPEQIKEVRGKGLMVGLELQDLSDSPSNFWHLLSKQKYLAAAASAYFLHMHKIRILPTLSQPFTLRIQPSAYIDQSDLDRFVEAVSSFCEALKLMDVAHIIGHQVGLEKTSIDNFNTRNPPIRDKSRTDKRVAFIAHLLLPEDAILWDNSLKAFSVEDIEKYLTKTSHIIGPTIFEQASIRSQSGDKVHLSFIALNLTSRQIADALRQKETGWIMDKIEAGLALACDEGCKVAGLGGFTSIVMMNGLRVKTKGIAITSGNALTVGMAIQALKKAAKTKGIDPEKSCLGVLGANGNTGSTYAQMMAPQVAEMKLIVRDLKSPRFQKLVKDIERTVPNLKLKISDNLEDLRTCSLIVTATNSPEPLIYPEHLDTGQVVICDVSLPTDVAPAVAVERPKTYVIQGGVVRLPYNDDFFVAGIPLDRGHIYACMAETLLMGLEGMTTHGSYGRISPEWVQQTNIMADKHGFVLGQAKIDARF